MEFSLAMNNGSGFPSSVALPDGISISWQDGVIEWNPSIDLLLGQNNIVQEQREFEFVVTVDLDDEDISFSHHPMKIIVVDPNVFDPYVPEFDEQQIPNAAVANQRFVFQPLLEDPAPEHQNSPVTWILQSAPAGMTINETTGEINWSPSTDLLGEQVDVTVRALAQRAGKSLTFTLDVNSSNASPIFETTFPTIWEDGAPFVLEAQGVDPEGHSLSYSISQIDGSPVTEDFTINEQTGQISWDSPITGTYEYQVSISETHNPIAVTNRVLKLTVVDTAVDGPINYEPLIAGAPELQYATTSSPLEFQFDINDPDQPAGTDFVFALEQSSLTTASIDQNGLFTWSPDENQIGDQTFRVSVTDSSPAQSSAADNIRYLTFRVEAIKNDSPVIESSELATAYVGTTLVHQVEASDFEDDLEGKDLTYSIVGSKPDGMTINPSTGQIRWFAEDVAINPAPVVVDVVVTDQYGATDQQSITITVSTEDFTAPTVDFYLKYKDGPTIRPGERIQHSDIRDLEVWATVLDNRGAVLPNDDLNGSWEIVIKNTGFENFNAPDTSSTQEFGTKAFEFLGGANQGQFEIIITATDAALNVTEVSTRYYIEDQSTFNIGKILNVGEDPEPITDRFEVIGNANFNAIPNQSGSGKYDLKLTSMDNPNDFVYLARNETASVTDALLGVVDGTWIPTGQYRLYLEVRCSEGCIRAVDERIIEVQNEARLGNLDLALSDLNVTLGGVPVPIIRTYSSALVGAGQDGFESDFSPGWNLNLLQSEISVSHPSGVTTDLNQPFSDGTRVFVSLPDGTIQRFTFDPIIQSTAFGIYIPVLNPDPEFNSQLYVEDIDPGLRFVLDEERGDGTFRSQNGNLPAIPSNFGSVFVLETENGLKYKFDIRSGKLLSIADQNDGRIEVIEDENGNIKIKTLGTGTDNQDEETTNESIVINRVNVNAADPTLPVKYRITSIGDVVVEDGKQVTYEYGDYVPGDDQTSAAVNPDSLGNLARVTHRDGEVESYDYMDATFERYLTDIYDNGDTVRLHADYYVNVDNENIPIDSSDERYGRLRSTSNANGTPTNFGFDLDLPDGRKVRSTNNSAGVAIEEVVNGRGDVVRIVQLVNDATVEAEKQYMVSVTRYNLRGLVTYQSKPFYVVGADNRHFERPDLYDEANFNPLDWASIINYDDSDQGRVLTSMSANGAVTTNVYDDDNGIFKTISPFGVTSVREIDTTNGQLKTTYTTAPDSSDRLNQVKYEYNDTGQQVRQIQVNPNGSELILSESGYDGAGFLIWTDSPQSARQYFAYDANGQQIMSWQRVSEPGRVDASGAPEFVTLINTTLDPNGSQTASGEMVVLSIRATSLVSYQYEIVNGTEYGDSATSQSAIRAKIDSATTDSNVTTLSESSSIENFRGQAIESRRLAVDSEGNETEYVSQTVYYEDGRVEYQVDEFVDTLPIEQRTGSRTYYDGEGRVEKTERLIGISVLVPLSGRYRTSALDTNVTPTVLSWSTTMFDPVLGRTVSSTSYSTGDPAAIGLTSTTLYNKKGQVTETRSEAWGADGTSKITYVTRTYYDSENRVELQTDSYLDSGVGPIFGTKTLYNDQTWEAEGSVRLEGVQIDIDGDNNTTVDSEGTEVYTTRSISDRGRTITSIGAEGQRTDYEYDSLGRQVATIGSEVMVDGQVARHRTETVFDEQGRVEIQRSNIYHDLTGEENHDYSSVQQTSYTYDELGRVVRTIFDDRSYGQVQYDSQGRSIAESQQVSEDVDLSWSAADSSFIDLNADPNDNLVPSRTMEYDVRGQLVAVELPDPDNLVTSNRPRYEYGYDVRGNQTLIRDPNGHETRLEFNDLGQQTSRTLPLGFGVDGELGTSDDAVAEDFSEHFEYDQRGRQVLHISFEGVHTVSVYDDVTGRMTETQFFEDAATYALGAGTPNEVRTYHFDTQGRQYETRHLINGVLTRIETSTYNDEGQLESVTNDEGTIHYEYDEFGRTETKSFSGREFTPNTQVPFDNVTEYTYDDLGRLETVTSKVRNGVAIDDFDKDPTNGLDLDLTTYTYDLVGNLDTTEYANGLIHEYEYDSLNRLESLYHWVDLNDDGIRNDGSTDNGTVTINETWATFDYELRADGKRIGAVEDFLDGSGSIASNTFTWVYDAAGRLISESLDSTDTSIKYDDTFEFDLTGNRLETSRDWGDASKDDYTTSYAYDANDRLQTETKNFVSAADELTTYTYEKTQQSSKAVSVGTVDTKVQTFDYDLQGRMSFVSTTKYASNGTTIESYTETSYEYDSQGNRVATELGVSNDGDTTIDETTRTEYLTDSRNHTGYSQVLQETTFDENGDPIKKIVYTIGQDQISQSVYERIDTSGNGTLDAWNDGTTSYFGTDGHGSVRVLYDLASVIVQDLQNSNQLQLFTYDAYGNLLNFPSGVDPLTSYLYSGEAFDFNIGQQYLRARWYDATNGRFNRLDPFFGNSTDPQSFHKYAYVHGDPIQGTDPTGMFVYEFIGAAYETSLLAFAGLSAVMNFQAAIQHFEFAGRSMGIGSRMGTFIHTALGLLNFAFTVADIMVMYRVLSKDPTAVGGLVSNRAGAAAMRSVAAAYFAREALVAGAGAATAVASLRTGHITFAQGKQLLDESFTNWTNWTRPGKSSQVRPIQIFRLELQATAGIHLEDLKRRMCTPTLSPSRVALRSTFSIR